MIDGTGISASGLIVLGMNSMVTITLTALAHIYFLERGVDTYVVSVGPYA